MNKQEYTGLEIAVIGMACNFPGASNTSEFWENLKNGKESISRFSDEELRAYGIQEKELTDPNYIKAKGIIDNAEYFDASFFGISPNEANVLDPQFRVLLQCAYNALEDASYDFSNKDNNTGVFVGGSPNFNWQMQCFRKISNLQSDQFSSLISNDKDFISTRLSYLLNLHGHSQTVYTACSTSLVAIDMACQSLLTGKCDVTIAGGVSLTLPYKSGYKSETGLYMSEDGHTRSFDVNATGTIWSDGVGTVVLKRLEDAIADGDNIHAVIKGSATNNDGNRKIGYTAPSIKGQVDVIGKAIKIAEISKESIDYIEGHGSATSLGDKIEISALKEAFKETSKDFSCFIGSVKSNFGHLNVAAGIAGFIKVCLMLKNATIPPSLNFETPNSQLENGNESFSVNSEPIQWANSDFPLRAGINSFGIGGTNAHIILEKAPVKEKQLDKEDDKHSVICLSANTPSALNTLSKNLSSFLSENRDTDISNLAYTLQIGREHLNYRKAFVAKDIDELIQKLSVGHTVLETKENPDVVFAFPGMGGFYSKMGKDLYLKEDTYRQAMDTCFSIVKAKTGNDLKTIMYDQDNTEFPGGFQSTQLMVFVFEYALAVLLKSWGIEANATVGYSLGEYVAATVAGIFSLQDALDILLERGRLINTIDTGGMIAIPLPKQEIVSYLQEGASIAIDNGKSVVVGGRKECIEEVKDALKKDDILVFDILDKHPGHTAEMNPIREEFKNIISEFNINQPLIPIASNVTGDWCSEEFTSPEYWIKHLAETVDFSKVVKTLLNKNPEAIYLEVGVGNFLGVLLGHHMDNQDVLKHVSIARSENRIKNENEQGVSDHTHLMKALASIWEYGGTINWKAFHANEKRNKLSLPTYPFEGIAYDLNVDTSFNNSIDSSKSLERDKDISSWFYTPSWKRKPLVLNDNEISQQKRNILVLDFNNSVQLSEILLENKHNVIQTSYADGFKKISENEYHLDYNAKNDVLQLFNSLEKENIKLDTIIDLTSVDDESNASLERIIDLFQCISKTRYGNKKLEYFAISSNLFKIYGNEVINPLKSGIISATKIIPQENININCRLIEIDKQSYNNGAGSFYKHINHELNALEPIVSYKDKNRWTQIYEQYPIYDSESKKSYIKNDGTYVIVGGLGDVGFTIAQYVLENFESNVVLVGRSKLPYKKDWDKWIEEHDANNSISKKIKRLRRLKNTKGKVSVMQADSTSQKQMESLFKKIKSKNGAIDGIFYSVGDFDNIKSSFEFVNTITEEQMNYHLPMKKKGLDVLKNLADNNSLDFVAVMSSFTSVLGGLGAVGYAVSNQYVDSFVHQQSAINDSTAWMSFNFSYWDMEGDGADFQERSLVKMDKIGDDVSNTVITVGEGKKIFERLLSTNNNEEQIVVSPIHFPSLIEKFQNITLGVEEEIEINNNSTERLSDIPFVAPVTETEKELAQMWEELFGFQIGVQDDFFKLGGDSLGIIKLVSKIQKKFDISIDIREIFKNTSFGYLLGLIENATKTEFVEIEPSPEKEYYPQSDAQKRFFILNQMSPEILTYNAPSAMEIEGALDVSHCESVLQSIINGHEILRTSFHLIDGLPVQKIHEDVVFKVEVIEEENPDIESIIKSFQIPFDLGKPTQFRACVCKKGDNSFYLITDIHHIIVDRTTFGLIMEDFVSLYNGKEINRTKITYKDYAVWQQNNDYLIELEDQKEFWLNEFTTIPEPLQLPADHGRSVVTNFNSSSIVFELTDHDNDALKKICVEQQTTMFTLLLAMYHVLLSKLGNQEDIVVGSSVLGRQRSDIERIMGVFVNTLPLRSSVTQDQSFKDYLEEFKNNVIQCFANQEYPFEKLVEQLKLPANLTRSPLFDTMFEYFNFSLTELDFPDFEIKDLLLLNNTSEFDLSLKVVVKENGKHEFNLEYRTDLFEKETVERFIDNYKNIIRSVIKNIDIQLYDINILTATEMHKLIDVFNDIEVEYDENQSLNSIFDQQVERHPEQVALAFEEEVLTYDELDKRSNQVAHYLISKGVLPGNLVGLMFDRSIEMIIGILGVIKAGAGYLPLDPSLPEKRIGHMIDRGGAVFLLTQNKNVDRYSSYLPVAAITNSSISSQKTSKVFVDTHKDDLAYCIFTSGSTGNPKGVMINHSNVINLVGGLQQRVYKPYKNKVLRVALLASYAFDASVQQIFGALLQGHSLYITNDETRKDGEKLKSFFNENEIDVSDGTPTHLRLVVDAVDSNDKLKSLTSWLLAGEVLSKDLASNFYKRLGEKTQLYNFYGPTETCVDSTSFKVDPKQIDRFRTIPIGKPLPGERVYVTNEYGKMVPLGTIGELCIAGGGLARRYVGDQSLTTEKFNTEWVSNENRVYRTGDMVRWLPDGNLEFHGRKDNQVKIRGYRIELGEIEVQLNAHAEIKHSVVCVKEIEGEQHIVVYYKSDHKLKIGELRSFLSVSLPDYMVPYYYVNVEEFSLTVNGKFDYRALPDFKIDREEEFIALSNDIERKLAGLYAQILNLDLEDIGRNSNFTELGGHSLKMVFLGNSIKKEFGVKISLKEIIGNPTIIGLSSMIAQSDKVDNLQIPVFEKRDYYPLSPAQKRMYFAHLFDKESIAYNAPVPLTFKGKLDIERLEESFRELIKRHESLRTVFLSMNGDLVQRVLPEIEFSLDYLNNDTDPDTTIRNYIKPFDLENGPLLRVGVIELSREEYVIVIDCHHIISDEVTITILLKDLLSIYKGEDLPELRLQYKDYVLWQQLEKQQNEVKEQKAYWLNKFSEKVPTLELPYDYPRSKKDNDNGGHLVVNLEESKITQLKRIAKSEGLTMYTLFLAMYKVLLYKLSGQQDIIVGTPVAARAHKDLESITGVFINALPVRNKVQEEMTFKEFVKQVQEGSIIDLDHQLCPIEDLIDELKIERDVSRNPLFDVSFNYMKQDIKVPNIPDAEIDLYPLKHIASKFDLSMIIMEKGNEIDIHIEYAKLLFSEKTIKKFIKYFDKILNAICESEIVKIIDIEILEENESQLLNSFGPMINSQKAENTIVSTFERQVKATPWATAVKYGNVSYTYDDLNQKANQLARTLQEEYDITKGEIVGVLLPKSDAAVLSILAILKLGAAYLPIDTNYPVERINYIIENSGLRALITDENSSEKVIVDRKINYETVSFDREKMNLEVAISPEDLAYVIYTSGSTGKPKGVMIEHGSNVNMSTDIVKQLNVNDRDAILWFASISFDASVYEIMMTLYSGATLVIPEPGVINDTNRFCSLLSESRTSIVTLPPSYLETLPLEKLNSLRIITTAGESANAKKAMEVLEKGIRYFNAYGPTECAVCVSTYEVFRDDSNLTNIPIGRPIANTEMVILDQDLKQVPVGVKGTIYVAGKGLAKGYLNNPELTAKSFITLPGDDNKRYYNTGDLGEWTTNRLILFHGRKDNQIKLRGFRIELGEIEGVLGSVDGVRNCHVVVNETSGSEKELLGYVILEDGFDTSIIEERLSELLPDYMVPRSWVKLDKFPLTINGKIDTKALLQYQVEKQEDYKAPQNDLEQKLVQIWSEVLNIEEDEIGVLDDFFDLGGNSLIAIQLITNINKNFGIQIKLEEVFRLKTVRGISELIDLDLWVTTDDEQEVEYSETVI